MIEDETAGWHHRLNAYEKMLNTVKSLGKYETEATVINYFIPTRTTPESLQMVTTAMKLRSLLLGRKAMTNLDSILKSRDITLLTKFHILKAMVFPVVMYGCESWTIKKAEH